MKNEVELCRLNNISSITKLELDQKEKQINDSKQGINQSDLDGIMEPKLQTIATLSK